MTTSDLIPPTEQRSETEDVAASPALIPPYADPEGNQETVPFIKTSLFKLAVVLTVFLIIAVVVVKMLRSQEQPAQEVEVEASTTPTPVYTQEDVKQADIALANQSGATEAATQKLKEAEKERRQKLRTAAKNRKTAVAATVTPQPEAVVRRSRPQRYAPKLSPQQRTRPVIPQTPRRTAPLAAPRPRPQPSVRPIPIPSPVPVPTPVVTPLPAPVQPSGGVTEEPVVYNTLDEQRALAQLGSWGQVPNTVRESQPESSLPTMALEPGQELEARLLTPIAWTNNAPPSGEYLARIESGPYTNAQISLSAIADDAGLLTLTPVQLRLPDGRRFELGATQVLEQGGQPLIAKRKKRGTGGFGKDLVQALANVGGAIAGQDRVQTTIVNSANDLVQGDSQSTSRDVIWFMKAGQKLKIIALTGKD